LGFSGVSAADGALLADHEIEMAVAVNVAAIERVPMLHLADGQRLACPGRAGPLEPARHTVAVAGTWTISGRPPGTSWTAATRLNLAASIRLAVNALPVCLNQ
jgi:hypothetical protein